MSIELLAPAGNKEKLITALDFGADAVYMGLTSYSLRKNAGNFDPAELEEIGRIKKQYGNKRLYCTMNILFSQQQIEEVKDFLPLLKDSPFDAFIVTDLGLASLMKKYLPDKELHLSTQASCINSEAAKLYHSLGFSRVILGREASLDDIRRIKDATPELELEAFVHGAMCMSYSGRCMLSSFLTGRSANQGDCSHTCRWNYRLHYALEEEERKGVYLPIEEEDGYTTILSSKDLCMIDHLDDLVASGLSSLKIEGRMKSIYYIALVTRAYRKALDKAEDWKLYRDDLFNVSHREYSTGFFYGHDAVDVNDIDKPTSYGYQREYLFLGTVGKEVDSGVWEVNIKNQIRKGKPVEYIGSDVYRIEDDSFTLLDGDFKETEKLDHGKKGYIKTDRPLKKGYILRSEADIKTIN